MKKSLKKSFIFICKMCNFVIYKKNSICNNHGFSLSKKKCIMCYKNYFVYLKTKSCDKDLLIKKIRKNDLLKIYKKDYTNYIFYIKNNFIIYIRYITNNTFFIEILFESYVNNIGYVKWMSGREYFIENFVNILNK